MIGYKNCTMKRIAHRYCIMCGKMFSLELKPEMRLTCSTPCRGKLQSQIQKGIPRSQRVRDQISKTLRARSGNRNYKGLVDSPWGKMMSDHYDD